MENATKSKKWEDVYNALKREITTGGYKRGAKFLTISEVSSRFNVSQITSRRALAALADENLIIQKPKLGTVIKNSGKIKVHFFIPEGYDVMTFSNIPLINFEILKGVLQEAVSEGTDIEFTNEKFLFQTAEKGPVLLLHGTQPFNFDKPGVKDRVPNFIFLHSSKPSKNFHTVRHDLHKAAYFATEHLISRGHRRIGLVNGFLSGEGWLPRFEGYLQALKEADIPLDIKMIKETGGYDREEDFNVVRELLSLKERPTAICGGNDGRALNALDYCGRQGIKVPDEMAICGIDNIHETEVSNPPLTTVDTGWEDIGKAAVRFAMELAEDPEAEIQDIVVEPKLIVRGST